MPCRTARHLPRRSGAPRFAPVIDASLQELLARAATARRSGSSDAAAEAELDRRCAASHRLAVYGTLAPGGPHHDELAACPGTWSLGTVTGRRSLRDYPVFTYDPLAAPVAVHLLCSAALPARWAQLDAFEGDGYRRILVPVRLDDGSLVVANLYEGV